MSGDLLIIGPAWVGDMVMAQSLFIRLRQRHPDAAIDVLAPGWSLPIIERMPEIRAGIELPFAHGEFNFGGRRALGIGLRERGYAQAIVLPNSWKSAVVPFFAGIPRRTPPAIARWKGKAHHSATGVANARQTHCQPSNCHSGL